MKDIIYLHRNQPGHYGNKMDYLPYILKATQKYNPNARIHFICDSPIDVKGIVYADAKDYESELLKEFKKAYVHMARNAYEFELQCIERWFIIYDYCKEKGIGSFVYCDSDCMLLKDVTTTAFASPITTNIHYKFVDCPSITTDIVTPHCHFLNGLSYLSMFLGFTLGLYQDRQSPIYALWEELKRQGVPWGVSDMFLWGLFCTQFPALFQSHKGEIDGEIYDTAIEVGEGFETEDNQKLIEKIGKEFYGTFQGRKLKFNCIHWHGGFKNRVKPFFDLHFS